MSWLRVLCRAAAILLGAVAVGSIAIAYLDPRIGQSEPSAAPLGPWRHAVLLMYAVAVLLPPSVLHASRVVFWPACLVRGAGFIALLLLELAIIRDQGVRVLTAAGLLLLPSALVVLSGLAAAEPMVPSATGRA